MECSDEQERCVGSNSTDMVMISSQHVYLEVAQYLRQLNVERMVPKIFRHAWAEWGLTWSPGYLLLQALLALVQLGLVNSQGLL